MSETKIAKQEPNIKDLVASPLIQQKLSRIAGKHFDHERFAQAVLILINRTPDLQRCTPTSLLDCMMVAAQQGWTIGGPRPGMYIVPYGGVATPIPSYYGFQETARQTDQEWEIEAALVREGDEFRYCRGLMPNLEHRPHDDEEAPITHAYAIARSKSGRVKFEVMTMAGIDAIRKRSKASKNGPWMTDPGEMCKKTVVRRLCKYLPSSPKMDLALDLSDRSDDVDVITASELPQPKQRINLRDQARGDESSPTNPGAAAPTNAPGSETSTGATGRAVDQAGSGKGEHAAAVVGEPPAPAQHSTGTVGETTVPTVPKGRPRKIPSCNTCGAPLAGETCSNPQCESRQQEAAAPDDAGDAIDENLKTRAHAFSTEMPVPDLRNWLMTLPPKVRHTARELAKVDNLLEATDAQVREVGYHAKLAEFVRQA